MQDNSLGGRKQSRRAIEKILRERERLSQILQEDFKKEVTILFTDITGYTAFTESKGDINSLTMVQKHNDIVFPLVEKRNGKVVKTIGDAVMASFGAPEDAVQAAIDIQNDLAAYESRGRGVQPDTCNRRHQYR